MADGLIMADSMAPAIILICNNLTLSFNWHLPPFWSSAAFKICSNFKVHQLQYGSRRGVFKFVLRKFKFALELSAILNDR